MAFDDIREGPSVPRTVTITGTRSIKDLPEADLSRLFAAYVRPFADPDARFYLGGAKGVDTMALRWLAERTTVAVTVVVPCTVADQPVSAAETIAEHRACDRLAGVVELRAPALSTAAYHFRNRWMVDRSDFVIGFPRGADLASGTWYTLNRAAEQGKPRLIVPL